MRALLTYTHIHEGTNVSWGTIAILYFTWCDFDQWHACISRWCV